MAAAAAPQLYFDEKWKLSKKEGRGTSSSSSFMRSSSCSSASLMRSSSSSAASFMRSSSSSAASFMRSSSSSSSSSRRRSSFTRKCASLVKQQRARFYIMRRCVTMLVCWRDYRDS